MKNLTAPQTFKVGNVDPARRGLSVRPATIYGPLETRPCVKCELSHDSRRSTRSLCLAFHAYRSAFWRGVLVAGVIVAGFVAGIITLAAVAL